MLSGCQRRTTQSFDHFQTTLSGVIAPRRLQALREAIIGSGRAREFVRAINRYQKPNEQAYFLRAGISEATRYLELWSGNKYPKWRHLTSELVSDQYAWGAFIDGIKFGLQYTLEQVDEDQEKRLAAAIPDLFDPEKNRWLAKLVGEQPFSTVLMLGTGGANWSTQESGSHFARLIARELLSQRAEVIAADGTFLAVKKSLAADVRPELPFFFPNLYYWQIDFKAGPVNPKTAFTDPVGQRHRVALPGRTLWVVNESPLEPVTVLPMMAEGDILFYRAKTNTVMTALLRKGEGLLALTLYSLAGRLGDALRHSDYWAYAGDDGGDMADAMIECNLIAQGWLDADPASTLLHAPFED